jgi:prophage DNA circulation protein
MPSLVVAHLVYGDARRASEIVDRNGIVNPLLISGGLVLEVLDA